MKHGMDTVRVRRSIESRTALGATMKANAPNSAFVQAHPDVKAATDDVVVQTDKVAQKAAEVASLTSKLGAAKEELLNLVAGADVAIVYCDAVFKKRATSDADVASAGAPVRPPKTSHPVAAPISLDAELDAETGTVTVTGKLPDGMKVLDVFQSQNPADPASWARIKGIGASRSIKGLPPGTYWFKARCLRGDDESDFCVPVSVIVR